MPLVKVKDKFQVTIPASIRKAANLDVGDLLEAEVREEGILLMPQTLTNRKNLIEKFRKAFAEALSDDQFAGKSDEALMEIATKAIAETRAARRSQK